LLDVRHITGEHSRARRSDSCFGTEGCRAVARRPFTGTLILHARLSERKRTRARGSGSVLDRRAVCRRVIDCSELF
jgi:hypothetical protein